MVGRAWIGTEQLAEPVQDAGVNHNLDRRPAHTTAASFVPSMLPGMSMSGNRMLASGQSSPRFTMLTISPRSDSRPSLRCVSEECFRMCNM